jgi:agmatine deiminase
MNTDTTPASGGFAMPAEWTAHEATWLAWPHEKKDWPGKFAPIPWVYAEIVRHLSRVEKVNLIVQDEAMRTTVRKQLDKAGADLNQVAFWKHPTDRVWTRDYGPIFLKNPTGEKAFLDFRFNGWAKYSNSKKDDAICGRLNRKLKLTHWQPMHNGRRIVLEGGSIDVNGEGLILTTEECLLSSVQERNPGFTREDYETLFRDYLGASKTIWLNRGIAGDDTHGHVDDLARFVDAKTIITVRESNSQEENHAPLEENWERLQSATDLKGKKLKIVAMPMPAPVYFDGQRLPASYANFYIANQIVLMPTFNDPNDRVALNLLSDLFPGRTVIGIHAVDLVFGLGTLHCMTQQEPTSQ